MAKSQKYKTIALIMAAGSGKRLGSKIPKQYLEIAGKTILRHSIEAFLSHPEIDGVCVVILPEHKKLYQAATGDLKILAPVIGDKKERQLSVKKGLAAIKKLNPRNVLIHDAARPFVTEKIISAVIKKLGKNHGAIPVVPVKDTLKKVRNSNIRETIDRNEIAAVQTPQGFDFATILKCHDTVRRKDFSDDAALLEEMKIKVVTVPGHERNFKITTEEDFVRADNLLNGNHMTRVGMGIDAHAFGALKGHGHHIMLCGIPVLFQRELVGHSDGDVGLHAVVDAILGAIGEGDIGEHFSSDDKKWRGANSAIFVSHINKLLQKKRGVIEHIDVTLIAEAPKVSPHRDAMRDRVAELLNIPKHSVSVKATTTDKLGFTGRGEGIAAQAIATIKLPNKE